MSRPTGFESRQRAARFAGFVARGSSYREAARLAGVQPSRALDIVEQDDFSRVVDGIRDGRLPNPLSVLVDTTDLELAA